MAKFEVRTGLEDLESYGVKHVAADIIVNANESNYPMPQLIKQNIEAKLANFPFNRYPPIQAENLSKIIADDLAVDVDNVKIGNGSSELLQMACFVFGGEGRKIAYPKPSFVMYDVYTKLSGSSAAAYNLSPTGYINPEQVIDFCKVERPSLLILCNPNNPTGNYNELDVIEKIIASVDCPVVVDEAYLEFSGGQGVDPQDLRPLNKLKLVAGSALALTDKYSNFMCLRTFSKAYGLASLRVGYAVGSATLMRNLGKAMMPYYVNSWSLVVAAEVYQNKELYREQIETIKEQRDMLREEFLELGFKVWPSASNFLLVAPQGELVKRLAQAYVTEFGQLAGKNPEVLAGLYLYKKLLEAKILVSDFSSHPALQGCLRITMGLPQENAEVLAQINRLLF